MTSHKKRWIALLMVLFIGIILLGCGKRDSPTAEIHDAVRHGNLDKVNSILAKKPELIKAKDKDGDTPLHIAASWGYKSMVKLLITNGADLNAKGSDGLTPLHMAVNQKDVMKLLIDNGADMNAKDNIYAITPLQLAVDSNDYAGVELLLSNGANPNDQSHYSWTPLHSAAHHGFEHLAKLLISKRADVNAKLDFGETPLHIAANGGHTELAKLLLDSGAKTNVKDEDGCTPLDLAAQRGHFEVVELLRKYGEVGNN